MVLHHRAQPPEDEFQLLGITDTAMLRPQVFALSDSGEVQIGLICSEKQAIDATLRSLAKEDPRFCPVADKYWNARGGSSSDGGAFVFTVAPGENGGKRLTCADKFGRAVELEGGSVRCDLGSFQANGNGAPSAVKEMQQSGRRRGPLRVRAGSGFVAGRPVAAVLPGPDARSGHSKIPRRRPRSCLRCCTTGRFDTGDKRRATVIQVIEEAIERLLDAAPLFGEPPALVAADHLGHARPPAPLRGRARTCW